MLREVEQILSKFPAAHQKHTRVAWCRNCQQYDNFCGILSVFHEQRQQKIASEGRWYFIPPCSYKIEMRMMSSNPFF